MGNIAGKIVSTRCYIFISILGIYGIDGHWYLTDFIIGNQLVGIGTGIGTVVDRTTNAQAWHTSVVQACHIGRTRKVITFEQTLLTILYPVITIESIGVQTCYDHGFIVECTIALAKLAEELYTRLVPSAGDNR